MTKEHTYTAKSPVNLLVFTQELHDALDTEGVTVITTDGLAEEASEENPWKFEVIADTSQPTVVRRVLKDHDPNPVQEDPEWDAVVQKLGDKDAQLSNEELKLAVAKLSEKLG